MTMDAPPERPADRTGPVSEERTPDAIDPADATIRGTDIEAHRIAALINGGMTEDEVPRDYPGLTRTHLAAAVAYAGANPIRGGPYPARTVKSALRAGTGGLQLAFAAAREDITILED